jgi:hypothetical protein
MPDYTTNLDMSKYKKQNYVNTHRDPLVSAAVNKAVAELIQPVLDAGYERPILAGQDFPVVRGDLADVQNGDGKGGV